MTAALFRKIRDRAGPLRVVVDTNSLASGELRAFLSASKANRAVLPDYVAMERFKPGNLEGLRDGLAVLRPFADQVVILKGTGEVSRLNPDESRLPDAMIDTEQTASFGEFCHLLDRALDGDPQLLRQLRERAVWAQAQMSVVLAGASKFSADLAEFEAFFSAADLTHMRRGGALTPAMHDKFDAAVSAVAHSVFKNAPGPLAWPSAGNWPNHFILRNAFCHGVYMLSSIQRGIGARKPDKARNDVVDVLLATYGTYFNGVMSNDALTNQVHHISRFLLETDDVSLSPDYLQLVDEEARNGRPAAADPQTNEGA
jgi:hypothetical protein